MESGIQTGGVDIESRPNKPKRKKITGLLVIIAAILFLLLMTGTIWIVKTRVTVKVPKTIATQIDFPLLLPQKLPGDFKVDPNSFSYSENTLFFSASDTTGQTITFSERTKPTKFSFEDFYAKDMSEPKNLNGTPFASVTGKTSNGKFTMTSVVGDKTWLLATTGSTAIGRSDMEIIAKNIIQK